MVADDAIAIANPRTFRREYVLYRARFLVDTFR